MYVTREVWGMSCLHKEPLQVRLEWLRLPGRQIPWALWAVLSAADGQKGSLPGGINQQLYWTLISPWNNGCVSSGCCLALVVLCQELRRADRVRTRDWTEILSEGSFLRVAVQGPLQAGCLKLSTRHCTSQSGWDFWLFILPMPWHLDGNRDKDSKELLGVVLMGEEAITVSELWFSSLSSHP